MSEVRADLTERERTGLENAIGAGMVEFGGPFSPDDPVITACRKLGLDPTDWHGRSIMPPDRGADDE